MKKNMGMTDRIVRTAVVVLIAILFITGQISGTLAVILGIVAVAFAVTSYIGWCPSYVPFGISTCKEEKPS